MTYQVMINRTTLELNEENPTAEQVISAAGLHPASEYGLIHLPESGPSREVGLNDVVEISNGEFYAKPADSINYFILNDDRYAWFTDIDISLLRVLGKIDESCAIWLEGRGEVDKEISDKESIKLNGKGIERFYSKNKTWLLNVHGVLIESDSPSILVEDALVKAGIDITKEWYVILKVQGQPKEPVSLSDYIDLTRQGIERLRIKPKNINNGETQVNLAKHQFSLLPKDESYLNKSSFTWRTVVDGKRWLIIDNYVLPQGYSSDKCSIAIEIPSTYPAAQLDMFYCFPSLSLTSKKVIPQTQVTQSISGNTYQRWSRHRPRGSWNPHTDSVISQLGLVEESLLREVEQ